MKTTLIASALIALSVAASGSAFAQRGEHGSERNAQVQQNNDVNDNGSVVVQRREQGDARNERYGQRQQNDRRDGARAYAQRGEQGNDHYNRNDQMRQQDSDRHDNGRIGPRGNSEYHRNDYGQQYHRDDTRGGGPRHDLRRGQRLGAEYRDNRYVVNDWRARRLSAPPRGQHWVRAGNDYVLASVATGLIMQILQGN